MAQLARNRIDWVDAAKGICIILVVMMHSTLGVEKALGAESWLHSFITWARPFRMPDFFLISGLFLAARINRPWTSYLDGKAVHFVYFYVLWMTIQFLFKAPGLAAELGAGGVAYAYLEGFWEPFGTLWFIYLLAVFFVVSKLLRGVPPVVVFAAAALLEILPIETGHLVIDEFASRYVYFFTGFWMADAVFRFAGRVQALSSPALLAGLVIWASGNGWAVGTGLAFAPVASLIAGFIGAGAVVATAVLANRLPVAAFLRYCGSHSIVIYLSFFLFMAASRALLVRSGFIADAGMIALMVTAAGVTGPLVLNMLVRNTKASFLFVRPGWARLNPMASAPKPTYSGGHDISLLKRPEAR
jgi:uncharacterized membrane protein YcfT